MSLINLDFRRTKEPLKLTVGETVGIVIDEDNIKSIISLTMKQFEELMDRYCGYIGEATHEEQEETILKQQIEIEELKEQLEIQEQHEELRREQIDEHEVF